MNWGLPWIVSGLRAIQCTPTSNSHGFRQSPGSFVLNCYLFWSRLTQSPSSPPICKLPILLLTSHLRQGSPVVFPSKFPTKLVPVVQASMSHSSYATWLDQHNNIFMLVQITMSILCDFFMSPVIFSLYSKQALQTSHKISPIYSFPWGERIGSCHRKIKKYLSGGHRKKESCVRSKNGTQGR